MNLEERMKRYKETVQAELHEEGIQETIRKSKTAFLTAERERVLSYREFLWIQTKIIQKKVVGSPVLTSSDIVDSFNLCNR